MAKRTEKRGDYPADKDTLNVAKASQQEDNMDNDIADEEAQNVTDGAERVSGEEAKHAQHKANEGNKKQ